MLVVCTKLYTLHGCEEVKVHKDAVSCRAREGEFEWVSTDIVHCSDGYKCCQWYILRMLLVWMRMRQYTPTINTEQSLTKLSNNYSVPLPFRLTVTRSLV